MGASGEERRQSLGRRDRQKGHQNTMSIRNINAPRLPCRSPGCTKLRVDSITPYCYWHRETNARFGHPLGRFIRKHEIAPYVQIAKQAFKIMGPEHPALVTAVDTVRAILNPGSEPIS